MAILIPLKAKYRIPGRLLKRAGIDPPEGTMVFNGGRFKATSSNQGKSDKVRTLLPRRKSYGPWY